MMINGEYVEETIVGYRTSFVSGRDDLAFSLDEYSIDNVDGAKYVGKKTNSRTLTVYYALVADTKQQHITLFDSLKSILYKDNSKFIFKDDSNIYFIGTVESITSNPVNTSGSDAYACAGEISIRCSDPFKYSTTITSVTATMSESGILTAHVDNDGSSKTFPTYRIKHVTENGYLGIVHPGGAFEMGNRDELDKEPYQQSEQLLTGFNQFLPYTGPHPNDHRINLDGSLSQQGEWLNPVNMGSGDFWHGGCYRAKLKADSNGEVGAKNFYCWWESQFMTGAAGETGIQQILLTDEYDKVIAGYGLVKPDYTGNRASFITWVPAGEFLNYTFIPGGYANGTPGVAHTAGYQDVLKTGSKLRFYYSEHNRYYEIDVPSIADKKITYIYIIIGQYGSFTKNVAINRLRGFYARKDYVDKFRDIPNRYPAGSEIVIDTSSDSITLNELPTNDELIDGSTFAKLPPGKTDIEFYTSAWCVTPPEVTVEYRKRWL